MSSPRPQSVVITHSHASCGDTDECSQFAALSTLCYCELGAAEVGASFTSCLVIDCQYVQAN